MSRYATLEGFVSHLKQGENIAPPLPETWSNFFAEGQITEIDEETWHWFLECLPPKWMRGNAFAFAEGAEPLRLFWRRQGKHFCRQLSWDETANFCRLAGIPLPH